MNVLANGAKECSPIVFLTVFHPCVTATPLVYLCSAHVQDLNLKHCTRNTHSYIRLNLRNIGGGGGREREGGKQNNQSQFPNLLIDLNYFNTLVIKGFYTYKQVSQFLLMPNPLPLDRNVR